MEFIPEAGTSLKINNYPIEIIQVKNNMVKTVRLSTNKITQFRQIQAELSLDG
jgi:Mg2+/Co2+ transporter CorB